MIKKKIITFIIIIGTIIFSCAFRDNPYDAGGIVFRTPELIVKLEFDSSKIESVDTQSLYIRGEAPLTLTLNVSENNYFGISDTLPISLWYFVGDSVASYKSNFRKGKFVLKKAGRHIFRIETHTINDAHAVKEIKVDLKIPDEKPFIISFTTSVDTFPIKPPLERRELAQIKTIVNNVKGLADYLEYLLPFDRQPYIKRIESSDSIVIDSFAQVFSNDVPIERDTFFEALVILHDKIGRTDTAKFNVYFCNIITVRGVFPPEIDSLYIINDDSELVVGKIICFGIDAYDRREPNDTSKGEKFLLYTWNFGDGYLSTMQNPCKIYQSPGNYKVTVTVRDDSMNACSTSIYVNIKPINVGKPRFTIFNVNYRDNFVPCTLSISVAAEDMDGTINSIDLIIGGKIKYSTDEPSIMFKEYVLTEVGRYTIFALAGDNEGNFCDTSLTIIVKDPQNINQSK